MNDLTVHLNGKPIYDIVYSDTFDKLSDYISSIGSIERKICIVSENNVASLYMDAILLSIQSCCKKAISFVFPEGEKSKNLDTVNMLYEKLILEHFDRKDLLIALGGGVVGDLTGFTAATYLRGIDFIQIPTSLLAQVDSSIGGKTGVDFKAYKNMIGAFHMPKLVYMNLSVLKTLDKRQFNSGMGEIVKHGIIQDNNYFNWLSINYDKIITGDIDSIYEMVRKSCVIKKNVVENDPTEKGQRALLNFGHTLGHAIEKYMDFQFLHGECVFIGMLLATIISYNKGYISTDSKRAIFHAISKFNPPKLPDNIDIDAVTDYTKNDKKMSGNRVKFILIKEIGEAFISMEVSLEDMKASLIELLKIKDYDIKQ